MMIYTLSHNLVNITLTSILGFLDSPRAVAGRRRREGRGRARIAPREESGPGRGRRGAAERERARTIRDSQRPVL